MLQGDILQEEYVLQNDQKFLTQRAVVEFQDSGNQIVPIDAQRVIWLGYGSVFNDKEITVASGDFCTFDTAESGMLNMSFSSKGLIVTPASGALSGVYQIQFHVNGRPKRANDTLAFSVVVNDVAIPLTICSGTYVNLMDVTKQIASGYAIATINSGSVISLRNDTKSAVTLSAINGPKGEPATNAFICVIQVS
jgi:hypothetical protein